MCKSLQSSGKGLTLHHRSNEAEGKTGKKMTPQIYLKSEIKISSSLVKDVYFIIQDEETGRFYITGNNGYNGFEGSGFADLEKAIKQAKKLILDDINN